MTDEFDAPKRRRVLKTLGASAVLAGIAGCTSDDDGSDDRRRDRNDAATTSAEAATGTPTATATDAMEGDSVMDEVMGEGTETAAAEEETATDDESLAEDLENQGPFQRDWDPHAADVWPAKNFDPAQTRSHPNASPPEPPLTRAWSISEDAMDGSPQAVAVGRRHVVTVSSEGTMYGVMKEDGEAAWSYEMDSDGGMTISDGAVYVHTESENVLHAVDIASGEEMWTSAEYGNPFTPTVAGGILYGIPGINAIAVDAETGDELWKQEFRTFERDNGPAVVDGVMYVPKNERGDWVVVGYDGTTGEEVWRSEAVSGEDVDMPTILSIGDGVVYTASDDGTVCTFDFDSGDRGWTANPYTEDEIGSHDTQPEVPPVIGDDHVAIGGFHVHVLSKDDGSEVWSEGFINNNRDYNMYADGTLYNLYRPGIIAYDPSDGTELWTYEHPDNEYRCLEDAVFTDERIYATGECGGEYLFALEAE